MLKKILICNLFLAVIISVSFAGRVDKNIKIVFFGDSITLAARVNSKQTFIGILENKLKIKNHSLQFINAGVSGNMVSDGVARLQKSVLDLRPDIVIVMFGCNDAFIDLGKIKPRLSLVRFKKDLNEIVDKLLKNGIVPILMTTPPIDNNKVNYYPYSFHGANHYLKPYIAVVRKIAKTKNITLVDHFKIWEKYCFEGGETGDLLFDFVHPNKLGYVKMARTISPVLSQVIMKQLLGKSEFKDRVVMVAAVEAKDSRNLAFGKSYVSSSNNKNVQWQAGLTDGRKRAVDGADSKIGGYATGKDPDFPKIITIDLGALNQVSRVLVYNMKKYGTKNVEVSISSDGSEFKKVGTRQFKKADGKVYSYVFPQQPARFIRIALLDYYITGLNSNYMFLREVEVFSEEK
ncbi:MAG: GDSL-type esterase/lipase family protein [Victivallaceae bacterium]|nr:GDSL-type esterase/lipase family protein [Victivallaceae bacterium]